jgi:hypothetical protein
MQAFVTVMMYLWFPQYPGIYSCACLGFVHKHMIVVLQAMHELQDIWFETE